MVDRRYNSLDGLRGYAALAVTFYHGILHFDHSLIERVLYRPIALVPVADLSAKALLIIFNGESAVIAFFILSGFVLRHVLDRLSLKPLVEMTTVFTWRRLVRIYPTVVVCMVTFYALSVFCAWLNLITFPHFALNQFVLNVTLYSTAMHGPSWSVQVEVCAIPFLLIAAILRQKLGALGLLFCVFYALIAIEYPVLVFYLPALWPYLFMFFVGMLLTEKPVADAVRKLHPSASPIALAVFLVGRHVTERAAISGLIAQALAGGLLVACIAYRQDTVSNFLSRATSLVLGRISYSFYLLNVIALYVCWAIIEARVPTCREHPVIWGLISAIGSVFLTIPAAIVSQRWVELPTISYGRRLEARCTGVRNWLFEKATRRRVQNVVSGPRR